MVGIVLPNSNPKVRRFRQPVLLTLFVNEKDFSFGEDHFHIYSVENWGRGKRILQSGARAGYVGEATVAAAANGTRLCFLSLWFNCGEFAIIRIGGGGSGWGCEGCWQQRTGRFTFK
jgi:hypothetical protein